MCECKSFVELQVKTNCRCDQTDRNSSNRVPCSLHQRKVPGSDTPQRDALPWQKLPGGMLRQWPNDTQGLTLNPEAWRRMIPRSFEHLTDVDTMRGHPSKQGRKLFVVHGNCVVCSSILMSQTRGSAWVYMSRSVCWKVLEARPILE